VARKNARSREFIPGSSKEVRRLFKLDIYSFSPNAIPGFKETAIKQIPIIAFNHLIEDYCALVGVYRRFRRGVCTKTSTIF